MFDPLWVKLGDGIPTNLMFKDNNFSTEVLLHLVDSKPLQIMSRDHHEHEHYLRASTTCLLCAWGKEKLVSLDVRFGCLYFKI